MLRQLLFAASIAAAVLACRDARMTSAFHELGRFHARDMHTLYPDITHFVVTPESVMANRTAALAFSRGLCGEREEVCFVFFWTDGSRAATGFPLSDREISAMSASYRRNHSTGADGFQCYNFGTVAERCGAR
ncbi:MAG TPA: hypothetical protein VJW73_19415 [Gemmatimonadaceae bacterium]|nr:hypothetical protein [Gemmatimonadaceae bacterium]